MTYIRVGVYETYTPVSRCMCCIYHLHFLCDRPLIIVYNLCIHCSLLCSFCILQQYLFGHPGVVGVVAVPLVLVVHELVLVSVLMETPVQDHHQAQNNAIRILTVTPILI